MGSLSDQKMSILIYHRTMGIVRKMRVAMLDSGLCLQGNDQMSQRVCRAIRKSDKVWRGKGAAVGRERG
jgi:hypothetical protein